MKKLGLITLIIFAIIISGCSSNHKGDNPQNDATITELKNIAWGYVAELKLNELGINDIQSVEYNTDMFKARCVMETTNSTVTVKLEKNISNEKWEVSSVYDDDNNDIVYFDKLCPNTKGEYSSDIYDYNSGDIIHEISPEHKAIRDKSKLSSKIIVALIGYDVISQDILSLNSGGFKSLIQIKTINIENAEQLCSEIENKIKSIVENYSISIISDKSKIIVSVDNDGDIIHYDENGSPII